MSVKHIFYGLLPVFTLVLVCRIWWSYPFAEYGLGRNLSMTTGKIISVEVVKKDNRSRYNFYEPSIRYEYIVNNVNYVGRNVAIYNSAVSPKETAEMQANNYKVGDVIIVYYSKKYPKFSVLNKNFPWEYIRNTLILVPSMLIFSITFFLLFTNNSKQN
jgi:hypothetical protein